jgi:hypothetical protein
LIRSLEEAQQSISKLHKTFCEVECLVDKPNHLLHIHATPQATWPLLAKSLLKYDWSVKDTRYCETVKRIMEEGSGVDNEMPETLKT